MKAVQVRSTYVRGAEIERWRRQHKALLALAVIALWAAVIIGGVAVN